MEVLRRLRTGKVPAWCWRGACLKLARCLPACLHACPADPSARKTWIMTEITPRIWRSRSEVLERCWERCLPEAGEVPASLPACMPSVRFLFGFVFHSCFALKNDQKGTPKKAQKRHPRQPHQDRPKRAAEKAAKMQQKTSNAAICSKNNKHTKNSEKQQTKKQERAKISNMQQSSQ